MQALSKRQEQEACEITATILAHGIFKSQPPLGIEGLAVNLDNKDEITSIEFTDPKTGKVTKIK